MKTMKGASNLGFGAALIACATLLAFGQEPTDGIRGVIVDASGARVPNATVKVEGANFSRTLTANPEGVFQAAQLPPGAYKVIVLFPGFRAASVERVELTAGKATSLEVPLAVGGVSERVTVRANGKGNPVYEPEAVEVGVTSQLVKGAPFTAEVLTEFTQTLADGNRVVRRQATNVYRDGQGRTRKDQFAAASLSQTLRGETATGIKIISDPVEGVSFLVNEKARFAERQVARPATAVAGEAKAEAANAEPMKKLRISGGVLRGGAVKKVQPPYPAIAKAARASGAVAVQVTIGTTGEILSAEAVSGHPLLRDVATAAAREWQFKPTELSGVPVNISGVLTFHFELAEEAEASATFNVVALGKQVIEGIECEGTRQVLTMQAGIIGNEQPLEIVHETWYSPALQVVVLSKQRDPRFGEKTIRLANVVRAEPDEALFKVPNDYTVRDRRQGQ